MLDVFLSRKVVFIITNSVDPDEMQHYAAFHQCLHCLPKYLFSGLQYTKGYELLSAVRFLLLYFRKTMEPDHSVPYGPL